MFNFLRSLNAKFIFASLSIGIAVAVLMSIFIGQNTRREFEQYILNEAQDNIVSELVDYYDENNSWDGVAILMEEVAVETIDGRPRRSPLVLTDVDSVVVSGGPLLAEGSIIDSDEYPNRLALEQDGQTIGWLYALNPSQFFGDNPNAKPPGDNADDFLQQVNTSIAYTALGATLTSLVLGILLSRTLTRPIQALSAATKEMAKGNLEQYVEINTQDEIGELAQSFNQMSSDLAKASQLRKQMTADIAHDLRTPLSIILGYTEALSEGKLPGSDEIFTVMHKEAQHLERLVNDLRILSLADAGELPLQKQPMLPRALLEQTVLKYLTQAEEKGVELQLTAAEKLPLIDVDWDRMSQVLDNLVSNALRFTKVGDTIALSATAVNGQVNLQVADSGEGIAAADLPHIFERFYRADKARSYTGESGLGLAIARSLVTAQGGDITVSSEVGVGTTFTIALDAHK